MNHPMKRGLSLLLAVMMLLAVVAGCSVKEPGAAPSSQDPGGSAPEVPAPTTVDPATLPKGFTIKLWHTRGSGKNLESMEAAVKKFNEKNAYGIVLEAEHIGNYDETLSKVMTSVMGGDNPVLIMASDDGIPTLAEKGQLVDMTPYAQRDGFDMNNILKGHSSSAAHDGQIVSMPFVRSTPVFFYNKTVWDSMNFEAPKSFEELKEQAAAITAKTGKFGFGMWPDPGYYNEALLISLGGSGMVSPDGKSVSALHDGTMLKKLQEWRSWVDEGWCMPYDVTKAETTMKDEFYKGNVMGMFASSAGLTNMIKNSAEAGFELGVANMTVYGGYGTATGGGNICILKANNSEEKIAAAWEFIKFVMSDEEAVQNAILTGYLPTTYTAAESAAMQDYYKENPHARVAYDQSEYAMERVWSPHRAEWNTALKTAFSYLIQDKSMNAEQALEYLKTQEKQIFGN